MVCHLASVHRWAVAHRWEAARRWAAHHRWVPDHHSVSEEDHPSQEACPPEEAQLLEDVSQYYLAAVELHCPEVLAAMAFLLSPVQLECPVAHPAVCVDQAHQELALHCLVFPAQQTSQQAQEETSEAKDLFLGMFPASVAKVTDKSPLTTAT